MPLAKDPKDVRPPRRISKKWRRKLSPEEKKLRAARHKKAGAERSLNRLKEKYGVEEKHEGPQGIFDTPQASDEVQEVPEVEPVFEPNPGPQTDFLAAPELEVLYGGAAGGGKSYALLVDPLRYVGNPNHMALIVRRTTEELRELVFKSQQLYPRAVPGAKWSERKMQWTFPSGARIWFSYLEQDKDVMRYQGQAFSYIGFDELTQWPTPFCWNYLRSRLRSTDPTLPIYMRATTNPGGPGHHWVKSTFIDPAPSGEAFSARDEHGDVMVYPKGHKREGLPLFQRRFIPAFLYDNPYLTQDDAYERNLLSLPEHERKRLLDGDWDVAEGAVFSEWDSKVHVCEPFDIPPTWKRFRSCDYGYGSHSAVHWFAVDPNYGTLYVYRELYVSQMSARDLAVAILQMERDENVSYGVLDSSCWHDRGTYGPTLAEDMIRMGCRWRPSDRSKGSRKHGANRLHELLRVDPDTELPGIVFFNTCRQVIADLPSLPRSAKDPDDVDTTVTNDHTYDSIRYGIMTRPSAKGVFEDWITGKTSGNIDPAWTPSDPTFGY